MKDITERFLTYVAIDTQSKANQTQFPSTEKQKDLLRLLAEEMKAMGISDVSIDEYGYVYGSIPSNMDKKVPAIGFIAHADTVEDMPGNDIKYRIVKNYDGKDIVLNEEKGIVMHTAEFPHMLNYVGQDLIVTDGTTLLGADDKAGITEILYAAEYMLEHPEFKHGDIKIAFTPDEEVGRGVDFFDVKKFGADFGYTMDGGGLGELSFENFNACSGFVTIHGTNSHPGSAKNVMVNSILVAMEFSAMLPVHERPESTEVYEGFSHLNNLNGNVEETKMIYMIRDHDRQKLEEKKARFVKAAEYLNFKYGEGTVEVVLKDSYSNMREKIEPCMELIDNAKAAMESLGITPIVKPIRGGTDGARLSYMGLPCPNLFTGGHNSHGRYEYIPVQSMEKGAQVILKIVELYAGK
ncbi:peptidase T [Merdimmobilis hominis]|jgi:tripeptide aminopeptidase|uniref:Peptidase T n=1 Tax=uncultured Anaerotruncus sp. TaxID=905011 RepID=A0A6N2TRR9_9FIRM|nr:peptidase T [Merdimmobilis hominis]MCD4835594.1 peptidase T [Merdimmobilis hominis]